MPDRDVVVIMTALDFLPMDPVTYSRSSLGVMPMVHAEVIKRSGEKSLMIRIKLKDGGTMDRVVKASQCEHGLREGAREFV